LNADGSGLEFARRRRRLVGKEGYQTAGSPSGADKATPRLLVFRQHHWRNSARLAQFADCSERLQEFDIHYCRSGLRSHSAGERVPELHRRFFGATVGVACRGAMGRWCGWRCLQLVHEGVTRLYSPRALAFWSCLRVSFGLRLDYNLGRFSRSE